MIRTTIKQIAARKLRLLTTGVAIVLGVAFMAGTLILTDTTGRTFDDLFADVNAGVDAYVRADEAIGSGTTAQRGRVDTSLVRSIEAVDGVAHAEPTIQAYAQVLDRRGNATAHSQMGPPTYGGAWIPTPELNPFTLVNGRAPARSGEVVLDKATADTAGLAVGSRTTVLTQAGRTAVRVVGIVRFGSSDSPGGASYALFDLHTAQALLGEPGRADGIRVAAEPGVSERVLTARLDAAVPRDIEVLTGTELTEEDQSAVAESLSFFNTFLLTFALVALFVGAFIIFNTFSILVAQRGRETALLRAIGASRRQVLVAVLLEALAVGTLSSAVGVAVGVAVAAGLGHMLEAMGLDLPSGHLVIQQSTVVASFLTGTLVSVMSAVVPARRAARTAPVEAMRDVPAEAHQVRGRLAAGLGVTILGAAAMAAGLFAASGIATVGIGVALVFVGVAILGPAFARPLASRIGWPVAKARGLTGALARQNATRNPRRTAATAAALTVGIALVASMTVLAASAKQSVAHAIDRSFTGDLVVDTGAMGGGGLSPKLAASIGQLPEVAAVTGVRATSVEIRGDVTPVYGVDAAKVRDVIDLGQTRGDLAHLGDRGLAISAAEADREHLRVGDRVGVRFAETGRTTMTIRAIYEHDDVAGDHLLDLSSYERNVAEQLDVKIFVMASPGTSTEQARAAVERVAAGYPQAIVQDRDEFTRATGQHIDQMLNMVYGLLALAILIALMGIANTLALSIIERTRELGLMRAVGMSRAQLRSAVRLESLIVSLLGAVTGLVLGIGFGWALVRALAGQGIGEFVLPVGQLVAVVGVAATAGVAAAILPARRAAKLDVLHAISAV